MVDDRSTSPSVEPSFFHSGDQDRGSVFRSASTTSTKDSFGTSYLVILALIVWSLGAYNYSPDSQSGTFSSLALR